MAPQLSEVWDQGDDWMGVTSARERRKRQNRLHQRAHRKKRHLRNFSKNETQPEHNNLGDMTPTCTDLQHSARTRQYQSQLFIAVLDQLPILVLVRCTDIQEKIRDFLQKAFTNWGLNLPTTRDLPLVTRLNTFDALARNALALHIPLEYLETDDHASVFNTRGPQPPGEPPSFPTHLLPTQLQKTVTHHSWIDLFPIPGLRDNVLQGIETGRYDEDELCNTLCCDLLDFETGTIALLVVWGESWDATGWEFSPDFFKKWGVLLQGCPEILEATNYWRQKRGERRIEYKLG
ncbi:hypothetical protein EDB81DRAFT_758635 [Dactylonectria macrodidyma]|uniref:BZIP domain-containing protein n=1 Tax=Dactylonectria macrodidyma TaxID=307937 RepID=A0A9P9EXF8_9HYPO|nr:hypothetical protein EDB81DRAFT_758635 [Dactylonectria macrodidyma]